MSLLVLAGACGCCQLPTAVPARGLLCQGIMSAVLERRHSQPCWRRRRQRVPRVLAEPRLPSAGLTQKLPPCRLQLAAPLCCWELRGVVLSQGRERVCCVTGRRKAVGAARCHCSLARSVAQSCGSSARLGSSTGSLARCREPSTTQGHRLLGCCLLPPQLAGAPGAPQHQRGTAAPPAPWHRS